MNFKRLMLATITCGFLANCGTDGDPAETPNESCNGGKCDSSGFEVFKGGVWTACEIAPGETKDIVTCALFGDGELLSPSLVSIQGTNLEGVGVSGGAFQTDTNFPAEIRHDSYPIDLAVTVHFSFENNIEGFDALKLSKVIRLESAASFPEQLIVDQPFDIWRVQLAALDSLAIFEAELQTESDFVDSEGKPRTLILRPAMIAQGEKIGDELFAVPLGATSIEGSLRAGSALTESTVTIDGPGRYVADAEGLRPAGDSDSPRFKDSLEPTDPVIDPEPEPGCEFDYITWLGEFSSLVGTPEAQGKLDELACTPIDADAFSAWHELLTKTLDDGLPATSSTLDTDELRALGTVLAAKPGSTDPASYSLVLASYNARLKQYVPNSTASISEDDRTVLDVFVAARPEVVSDAAYLEWFAIYEPWLKDFVPNSSATLDENDLTILSHIKEMRPMAEGVSAYTEWFETYEDFFIQFVPTATASISDTDEATLSEIRTNQPASTTTSGFTLWATLFTQRFNDTGSVIDDNDREILDELAKTKPCVDDTIPAQTALDGLASGVNENKDLYVELTQIALCAE